MLVEPLLFSYRGTFEEVDGKEIRAGEDALIGIVTPFSGTLIL